MTGLALTAAYCHWALFHRERRRPIYGAPTVLPFAAWCFYVQLHFGARGFGWLAAQFLRDLAGVILHPYAYPWGPVKNAVVISASLLALAGSLSAIGLSFRFGVKRFGTLLECLILVEGVVGLSLVLFGSRDVWIQVYAHARVLSALFVFLTLRSLERRRWSDFVPVLLVLPRIGMQVLPQVVAVVQRALP